MGVPTGANRNEIAIKLENRISIGAHYKRPNAIAPKRNLYCPCCSRGWLLKRMEAVTEKAYRSKMKKPGLVVIVAQGVLP